MSKTEKNKVKQKMQMAFELPKELLKDYSRITIIGGEDIWIENYKSILEYDEQFIRFSSDISIYGENLSVAEISLDDILIIGKIRKIEFE